MPDTETPPGESSPPSLTYQALKAKMDAWEMWEDMTAQERLALILDTFAAESWSEPANLNVLAVFFHDAAQWMRVKARGKAIGVNVYDLERAVKDLLKRHAEAQHGTQNGQGAEPPSPKLPPRFQTINAQDLFSKAIPPQQWIVPGILPVGATLFTGRGKDGKSLLAWNLCFAVAMGGVALSRYPILKGDVLYLALEDGERRAQARLKDQVAHMGLNSTAPAALELVLWDAPKIGEGFEERLLTWLDEHKQPRLVVIDILEKVRPRRARNGSVYADDYAAIAPVQRIAQERNIGVLIVHHSNKTNPDDFRDTASGSMGLIGACDTFWSLKRIAGAPDAVLCIIGRDVEAQELAMEFKDGFWSVLGDAETFRLSKESTAILDALHTSGKAQTPAELAKILQVPVGTIRVRLSRMVERGEVLGIGGSLYIPRTTPTHISPHIPPLQGGYIGGSVDLDVTGVTPVASVIPVTPVVMLKENVKEATERGESVTWCYRGVTGGGVTPGDENDMNKYNELNSETATEIPGVTGVTGLNTSRASRDRARLANPMPKNENEEEITI